MFLNWKIVLVVISLLIFKQRYNFMLPNLISIGPKLGGLDIINEIARICNIDETKYVLDVGCGAGKNAIYLAKKYGCRVMGIDISREVVEIAEKNASSEKLRDRVSFVVGDSRNIPFGDNSFDVVICESVLVFLSDEDRKKAISEYKRVVKSGGYICLRESSMICPKISNFFRNIWRSIGIRPEYPYRWVELLSLHGLEVNTVKVFKIKLHGEILGRLIMLGIRNYLRLSKVVVLMFLRRKEYGPSIGIKWRMIRSVSGLSRCIGVGLYVGRKY